MPELPEVETTRKRIAPLLLGRTIQRVRTTPDSYFFLTRPAVLRRGLEGRTLHGLERRGKYLVASLDDSARVLIHLGMTGQLFSENATSVRLLSSTQRGALDPEGQKRFEPDRHTHLQLEFEDQGPDVRLRDVRKFGKVRLLRPGESDPRLDRLGIDALEARGDDLFRASRKRTRAIKNLLLDQKVLAGIGNIYADEALFGAGIRPARRAGRLSRRACDLLIDTLQAVLRRSIETGGSSIRDYVAPDGTDGAYQDERRVYARAGQPCRTCGTAIRRIVLGQRSSCYCPRCQS